MGVLAVLTAVIFGARVDWKKTGLSGLTGDSGAATSTVSGNPATSTPSVSVTDPLYSAAMKIVDRPISVKVDLTETTKQLIIQKINEASDMIRTDYNYANQWYDLGAYRKMIGDYTGAVDAWLFVGKIRPDDSVSLHNLGDLYYFLKNYPKAEEYFMASIVKNPQNVDAYIQLAAIYTYNDLSKTSQVEPLLLSGIAVNPKEPNLLITLGKYYQNKADIESARKYFEQALVLNPKNTALEQELQLLGK